MPAGCRRLARHAAVLSGGVSLVLAPSAAASAGAAAAMPAVSAAPAAASGGTWGNAREVAGALNTGGSAAVNAVSCRPAGDCVAAGSYEGSGTGAFTVSEKNGAWGAAQALRGPGGMEITSVSCASAGNCSAGGFYAVSFVQETPPTRAFVATERNGTWGPAQEVAAKLNTGVGAQVNSVSCASAGNCAAGGFYTDTAGREQAFVVTERNGTWGPAREVAAKLNTAGGAGINSVSCASAGNCSAGGSYSAGPGQQGFVVDEQHGIWRTAQRVPGTGTGSQTPQEQAPGIVSVSCGSAGNCSAGGFYIDAADLGQAFVLNERNGTWGKVEEVPGSAKLNTGGAAFVLSVSCATAGNCSAGGFYTDSKLNDEAFVVNERNGTWGKAEQVPGTAVPSSGGNAQVSSVSCASAGNCSADGAAGESSAFVVSEVNGTWRKAEAVPGITRLNTGGSADIVSVSCASAGHCSTGGFYSTSSGDMEAFVVSET